MQTRPFFAGVIMDRLPCVSFVGRSNSGKTTLLEHLISLLAQRGYRVAVIKHTCHRDVETDLPGTDTRRLWDTAATHTAFFTPERVVHTHRYVVEPSLEQVLAGVYGVDVILLEGYKGGTLPKIEVVRAARDPDLLPDLQGRIACVTDVAGLTDAVPCFGLDDRVALADWIEEVVIGDMAGN